MIEPMPQKPERIILIHGAWAGAWVWDDLVMELAGLGREAIAIDLPGDGAHPISPDRVTEGDFYTCISDAILSASGPVVLLGHSGGGMLVTAGAIRHPDHVSHGIWVAGMLIPDGRSFDDVCEDVVGLDTQIGITPHVKLALDGLSSVVPREPAMAHFFDDFTSQQAELAAARLTPQPAAGRRISTVAGPSFNDLSKLYIQATEDKSVLPEVQRKMCEGVANLDVQKIHCGHVPQVKHALQLAEIIDNWLLNSHL